MQDAISAAFDAAVAQDIGLLFRNDGVFTPLAHEGARRIVRLHGKNKRKLEVKELCYFESTGGAEIGLAIWETGVRGLQYASHTGQLGKSGNHTARNRAHCVK